MSYPSTSILHHQLNPEVSADVYTPFNQSNCIQPQVESLRAKSSDAGGSRQSSAFPSHLPSQFIPTPTSSDTLYHRKIPSSRRGNAANMQDRPFKCGHCLSSFHHKHDVVRHERIHLPTKPFICATCNKDPSLHLCS